MATQVVTSDVTIFIDPAVSLAPRRFGLPPHEVEWRRLRELANEVYRYASESDVIVVTHYHYDHHDLGKHVPIDIYEGKRVLLKDPRNSINVSQRIRAAKFLKAIKGLATSIEVADGRLFRFGRTKVLFSGPVRHGYDERLGYVLMALIDDGEEGVLFTSDIEGFVSSDSVAFAKSCGVDVVLADGPPTYLAGYKLPKEVVGLSIRNTAEVLSVIKPKVLVLDHHLLRDVNYVEVYEELRRRSGALVIEAARFMGREPDLLEVRRRELYGRS